MSITPVKSSIGPREVRPLVVKTDAERAALAHNYKDLERIGIQIGLDHGTLLKMAAHGMDADLNPLSSTQASITTPIQFLQHWLPGFVHDVTAARRIDELVGIVTQGTWSDEEIVQGEMDLTGLDAVPYGDTTNTPLSNWNANYIRRSVVRFEQGMRVGRLEEDRASAVRIDSAASKRMAVTRSLEITRNEVGFRGYNNGNNRTYGFLNAPNLPAYISVAAGTWATKDYLAIVSDLLTAINQLRTQSRSVIDVRRMPLTLAIATNAVEFLSRVSQFGNSVGQWLRDNYPNVRVVDAPELDTANGGAGVFYLYAESVDASGTDDGRTFIQMVPNKFLTLGVDQRAKFYEESYSNATAGVMNKRPYAVVRYTGIS